MTPEQATALIVAITGLIGAIGIVAVQLRQIHGLVNSKMTDLLNETRNAATSRGELVGRDYVPGAPPDAPSAPESDTASGR